jgi:hypothetical protein
MCIQLELEFGSHVQKTQKKREEHLILMNFEIKKFTVENTQKQQQQQRKEKKRKKTLMFGCGMRSCNF